MAVLLMRFRVSGFNTQPPEGGWYDRPCFGGRYAVSTHSRPKAAELEEAEKNSAMVVSTHSRPKAAETFSRFQAFFVAFQHTAARRRLGKGSFSVICNKKFQHTAARRRLNLHPQAFARQDSFNTQPPEGG